MSANNKNDNYSDKAPLCRAVDSYPEAWSLTPVNGKKPYRSGWQKEDPRLTQAELKAEVLSKATGLGLRCGQVSGGILCVDFDGFSALEKWKELSGGIEPPPTVGWTSGKPGRFQLAFQVPEARWDEIATKKIPTAWDDSGKPTEYLEIRWDGCQSVLPPSWHPETGGYAWLANQSLQESEIAIAPDLLFYAAKLEPKPEYTEQSPSDATDNPWDIRNFAHYLDGYEPDGRREWTTCKCPAHNGVSNDSLHINQDSGAFKCHADCDPKAVYHAALELAKQRGYSLPGGQRRDYSFGSLARGLGTRLAKYLNNQRKRIPWGFGRKGAIEVEVESFSPPRQESFEYEAGDRIRVWQLSQQEGYRHILDTSDTGTGKSFDAGRVQPEMFGAVQVMYVSTEHRNPSVSTLKAWADLEARHKGLKRDEHDKLRRVDKDRPWVIPPNCGRNETIAALRNKNIPGADTADLICPTCPHFEPCKAGATYNYLHDSAKTLKQPRIRVHPDSLRPPTEYDYSNVVLIWDEGGETLKPHRTIEVRDADICRTMADLLQKLPALAPVLLPVLSILHQYICGEIKQPDKFGWKDSAIRTALPTLTDLDLDAIKEAFRSDPRPLLNTTEEYGVDVASLPRKERKHFTGSDEGTADRINRQLALNWFLTFLEVLLGHEVGDFQIANGTLRLTVKNERFEEIAQAAKLNIYLDATTTASNLAKPLGLVDVEQIATIRQHPTPCGNLEITQIATVGRLGNTKRSEFCQSRIDAIIAQIQAESEGQVAVIDFKRHVDPASGHRSWWTDSRGINDLETCSTLVLIGTPCPNLGDLEAEFTVLYGRPPQEGKQKVRFPVQIKGISVAIETYFEMEVSCDREFQQFVHRRILANFHQAIGRLRAHRRPGEQLRIYVVADFPLDFPVRIRKASELCPQAATKTERVELAIRGAVKKLGAFGQKITQQAIANLTGYSRSHIARFQPLLQMLIDSYSKMSNPAKPPPDPAEAEWVSQKYLPLLATEPPAQALAALLDVFEAYGGAVFRDLFEEAPGHCQVDLLSYLLFALPLGDFQALAQAAGMAVD